MAGRAQMSKLSARVAALESSAPEPMPEREPLQLDDASDQAWWESLLEKYPGHDEMKSNEWLAQLTNAELDELQYILEIHENVEPALRRWRAPGWPTYRCYGEQEAWGVEREKRRADEQLHARVKRSRLQPG